jgi:glycosyltransferase involved in cell wall biosynthesis
MTDCGLPSASVVVAAYNAEATIRDCVASLLELRYPRDLLEILVVENGSSDGTPEILQTFGGAIKVVEEGTRGPAAARNAGIRIARGEIVAFTDADCTVDPDWLRELVAPLDDPEVGIAGGPILARRPARDVELYGELVHDHRRALLDDRPPYAITMNWASRRSILVEHGPFDAGLRRGSDGELAYRIVERGHVLAFCPTAVVYHRNERSLAGLFREGLQHGLYGVAVRRRYARFIREWRAENPSGRARMDARAGRIPARQAPSRYDRAFRAGKRLGQAGGQVWFAIAREEIRPDLRKRSAPSAPEGRAPRARGAQAIALLQSAVTRTTDGPLRPLWRLLHQAAIRGAASAMRFRHRDRAVYLKGSFALGDPVYGLSDVDLIVVTADHPSSPGENRQIARRRWERLLRTFPPLRQLMQHSWIYEESELRAATSATCLTYGIEPPGREPGLSSAYLGSRPLHDDMALLAHPPLASSMQEWRLVAGRDRRRPEAPAGAQARRINAWLELQFLWRWFYRVCLQPDQPHVPFLCVKFVSDPVRIWLWMTRGEYVGRRETALQRGLVALPEEEDAIRRALALRRALPRSPEPPLGEFLPFLLRLTSRIAGRISADLEGEASTQVRLLRGDRSRLALPRGAGSRLRQLFPDGERPELLPLVDWRALAIPPPPDETFSLVPADPTDLRSMATAAKRMDAGGYAAVRTDGLLLFPARVRALLRSVQCAATDPVSFALAEGRDAASFPDVTGWSASDWARRAVAEHRAWLASCLAQGWEIDPNEPDAALEKLGRLLTAARAALFLESLTAGRPELALPLASVAKQLRERDRDAGAVAVEAAEAYRTSRRDGTPPDCSLPALAEIVRKLPPYAL